MPPPMPVSMPSSAAITGSRPWPSAVWVPDTAKSARPAASKVRTILCRRCRRSARGEEKNTTKPARTEIPRYRQSLSAAGGIAPIRTSRVMPPAVAVAHDTTSTPNRSSRCLTPAAAPLRANTNVPTSSSTVSVPVAYSLNPASVSSTCSAPNVGIVPGHGPSDGHDRDDDHQHVEQQRDRGCEPDVDIVGPSEIQIGQRAGLVLELSLI